jgi:MFS family permease
MFPVIMQDLGLNEQDAGTIIGVLGLAWGIFALLMGGLSDRIGRRKVLLPAIFGFSILSGISGLATGLVSLIVIRAIMGVAEGSFCPTSFAATNDASHPSRRGFNQGWQQSGFALFGLAIAPILATQLLQFMSWRWVFVLVAVPGIIVGLLMAAVIREPQAMPHAAGQPGTPEAGGWGAVWASLLKSRNLLLSMVLLFCTMACVFVLGALLPVYFTKYLHWPIEQMGFVTSAVGFGGFAGQFGVPWISDSLGRRPVAIVSFLGAAIALYVFQGLDASAPVGLFASLFIVSFFSLGVVSLITGPIATEAASRATVSSAIGVVVGAGEIFGGGVAPIIAGWVARNYGIQNILWLPLATVTLGILVSLLLKETAPKKMRGQAGGPHQAFNA